MAKSSHEIQNDEAKPRLPINVAIEGRRINATNARTKRFQRGTTLQEMMVTLCIFLAVIVFLVVAGVNNSHMQKVRHEKTCFSNMHLVGLSLLQYTSDNDDTWPSDETWKNRTFTTDKLDGCPDAASPSEQGGLQGVKGYSYNEVFTTTVKNQRVGISYDVIKIPMLTVALCEEAAAHPTTSGPNPYHTSGGEPPNGEEKGWLRHNGGANYLFADGHVKWYRPDSVGYNDEKLNTGRSPTFSLGVSETPNVSFK